MAYSKYRSTSKLSVAIKIRKQSGKKQLCIELNVLILVVVLVWAMHV